MLDLVRSDLKMQPTTAQVDKAMIAARAGLGLLCEHGVTHAELREAVFNGFRSHGEAVADGFDMSEQRQCILGRAVGDYSRGTELLGLANCDINECNRLGVLHGFLVLVEADSGYDADLDGEYDYGDLAQAWERILVPEWWAVPKTKTIRVMVDVVVPIDAENAATAYQARDLIEMEGEFKEVSLYSWTTDLDPDDERDDW